MAAALTGVLSREGFVSLTGVLGAGLGASFFCASFLGGTASFSFLAGTGAGDFETLCGVASRPFLTGVTDTFLAGVASLPFLTGVASLPLRSLY